MRPRLIPVLLLDRDRRLVKTVGFGQRTYIGDPFNVIRLFNEKEVDEIVVLDIDATVDGRKPDHAFVRDLATECFIPLAFGGGLHDMATCEALGKIGVEKFVIGSAASEPSFLTSLSRNFGAQAVVGCVDVCGAGDIMRVAIRSGRDELVHTPIDYARLLQDSGCGEIVVQSVGRDGTRDGYDLNLISRLADELSVPIIALGGAGTYDHLKAALQAGASAAASGSAFSFIGRLRAVLINYPSPATIDDMAASTPAPRDARP
jgi:imidazole glycerol-phosphate synthase subunit HisF